MPGDTAQLVSPSLEYQEQYMRFYQEWKTSGEDMVPWVIERDPSDFSAYLDFLYSQMREERTDWVRSSTFWLVDQDEVVGAVNIRHRLNEKLLNSGGHIGYGIRPSERRKGYATLLLGLALQKTRELGIDNVLVVCDEGNIGSERTIIKKGGVFESEYTETNGNVVRRFWIDLSGG